MADGYWRYSDPRYQTALAPPVAPVKRARPDYGEVPGGQELYGYYPRDEERVGHHAVRETEPVGASYDRYLRNGISTYGTSEPVRPVAGGMTSHPTDDLRMLGARGMDGRNVGYGDGRNVGYGGGRVETPLPPDASSTIFVEGLPSDCTRREVSHIFRPFVGFREVRLVNKESRHPGGDPWVLCFVDFSTPSQAAVALDALQGYKFDEHDRDSAVMRLQFSRFPGPRSAGPRSAAGSRGKR